MSGAHRHGKALFILMRLNHGQQPHQMSYRNLKLYKGIVRVIHEFKVLKR